MDQNYNNSQNDFLWALLANPANDAYLYTYNLQRLVNDFPQSGILQALLAHSSDEKNLKQASVYFNPKSLYKLINAPASFIGVSDEKIIVQPGISANGYHKADEHFTHFEEPALTYHPDTLESGTENYFNEQPFGEEPLQTEEHHQGAEHQPVAEKTHTNHLLTENFQHTTDELPVTAALENLVVEEPEQELALPAHEAVNYIHDEVPVSAAIENLIAEEPEYELALPALEAVNNLHDEVPVSAAVENLIAEEPEHELALPVHETVDHEHEEVPVTAAVENLIAEEPAAELELPAHEALYHIHEELAVIEHPAEHDEGVLPEAAVPSAHVEETHHITDKTVEPVELFPEDPQEATTIAEHTSADKVEEQQPGHPVEEETYSEITGIEQIAVNHANDHQEEIKPVEQPIAHEPIGDESAVKEQGDPLAKEEELIIENIAATDYFMFDRAFSENKPVEQPETEPPVAVENKKSEPVAEAPKTEDIEQQDVSKYHDEKMPYSFMWWLDKTRKEHASVYQPYLKTEAEKPEIKEKKPADELQQQYYENIFHITSVEDLDKSTAPYAPTTSKFDPKRKEQVIIERFIQEEPQIKPQSSDKLDNENKAKKSSEDRDELVTETLAGIYSDQMLYHKAIASYKKLILKFPEKSRYFVEKIEQLEKKTN